MVMGAKEEFERDIDYRIEINDNRHDLECDVSALMKKNWTPLGGVCVYTMRHGLRFAQAMIWGAGAS